MCFLSNMIKSAADDVTASLRLLQHCYYLHVRAFLPDSEFTALYSLNFINFQGK